MNSEMMDRAMREASGNFVDQLGTLSEHAEHFVNQAVEKMVDDGAAIELTEDEERMLKEYRKYRERNASGVFSWKVEEQSSVFVLPQTPSLILDPRNVSAV